MFGRGWLALGGVMMLVLDGWKQQQQRGMELGKAHQQLQTRLERSRRQWWQQQEKAGDSRAQRVRGCVYICHYLRLAP